MCIRDRRIAGTPGLIDSPAALEKAARLKWLELPPAVHFPFDASLVQSPMLNYTSFNAHNMHHVRDLLPSVRRAIFLESMRNWPDYDCGSSLHSICDTVGHSVTFMGTDTLLEIISKALPYTEGATACEIVQLVEIANMCYLLTTLMRELQRARDSSGSGPTGLHVWIHELPGSRSDSVMWLFQTTLKFKSCDGWNSTCMSWRQEAFANRISLLKKDLSDAMAFYNYQRKAEIERRNFIILGYTSVPEGASSSNDTSDKEVTISGTSRRDEWYKNPEITDKAIVLE